jgi:hypothetical protein
MAVSPVMKKSALLALILVACSRGDDDGGTTSDARRFDAHPVDGAGGGADSSGGGADARIDSAGGGADAPPATLVEIQDVRDGTVANDAVVTIEKVFVTGVGGSPGGNITIYIQEPQGDTAGSHVYPQYAGIAIFIDDSKSTGVTLPAVGDCINVTGTVDSAFGLKELKGTTRSAATACGTAPTPHVVATTPTFVEIATDTDPGTAGDQDPTMGEVYESVLISVAAVEAVGDADAFGEVPLALTTNTSGPTLDMDDFLFAHGATNASAYANVVGIYTEFSNYKIQPRSAADLTPL